MKTKNFGRTIMLVLLMGLPVSAFCNTTLPADTAQSVKMEADRGQQLLHRLEEIKAMDKSSLTRSEKKDLRKEVKEIRKEMKDHGSSRVYISVGALIIIILLLILIL